MESKIVYKIVSASEWELAKSKGVFEGAEIDIQDGFIHFSAAHQVRETAAKHFSGREDLLLVEVDSAALGEQLKWEVSRGGDLFPHLYDNLSVDCVKRVSELPLDDDGHHIFADLE